MAEVTPVTLLIGLAGAGKTTLLDHVLARPEAAGIAVVTAQPDPPVWLRTGCVCCAPRDDVSRAFRTLLPRVRRDEIRRVVIETTGLADPGPILATLLSDTVAASAYRLDAIIAVVDAVSGAAALDAQESAALQVALADRIVLTKAELKDPAALQRRLQRRNPFASVVPAEGRAVDPAVLLGPGLWGLGRDAPDSRACTSTAPLDEPDNGDDFRSGDTADGRIRSFCLTHDRPLPWPAVSAWLERLILLHGDALLRMKAIVHLPGQPQPVAIHSARHLLFPPVSLPAWPAGDPRQSRFAFIAKGLPRAVVAEGLEAVARIQAGIE